MKMTDKAEAGLGSATEDAPSGRLSTASSRSPVTIAGRELDALVAEKVMGWRWEDCFRAYTSVLTVRHEEYGGPPFYSTDIAAAWDVVEKMRERRADFYIRFVSTWTVEFDSVAGDYNGYTDGDTAPLAICLAALKAVEKSRV